MHIEPETLLEWIVEGNTARVVPVPDDPIAAFRGSGKKGEVRRLLADAGATSGAMSDAYVLDTSALLALRSDETGAKRVEDLLRLGTRGKARVLLSFMSRMEILSRVATTEDEAAAQAAIRLLDAAASLKSRGGLSVGEAWIAATALVKRGILVHNDPEFARARDVRQERLPA